jgi:type II secretory pathway pseudopilin PulG
MTTRRPQDGGETLIESLISIIIIGIAVAAILGAVASGSELTGAQRDSTTSDVALKAATEYVKQLPYSPSATYVIPTTDPPGVIPAGFSASVTEVRCYQPGTAQTTYSVDSATDFPVCTGLNDNGLQLVTITAAKSNGSAIETTQIMKRKL